MSTEIMRRISYLPVRWTNRLKMAVSLRAMADKRRFKVAMAKLMAEGTYEETRYTLRKRYALTAMQDMYEIGLVAQDYMRGDPFMASLVIPIAQAFAEGTARDIRNLGSR